MDPTTLPGVPEGKGADGVVDVEIRLRSHHRGKRGQQRRAGASARRRPGNRPSGPKFQDAHIYTAPMDHNYRTAENGNGGARSNRGTRFVHQELEALPTAHNGAPRIFAFVDDLFFLAKIQETARKLNVKVQFVKSEKEILDAVAESEQAPSLIIMDLNNASVKPVPNDHQAEVQTQEADEYYRLSLPCAGRSEDEGTGGGMRHGFAALGLFAEPAATASAPRFFHGTTVTRLIPGRCSA